MASFTEQATLKVVDQSSAQLRKINAELKKLMATAKSLQSTKVKIDVNVGGLSKASGEIRKITAEINRLKSAKATPKIDITGVAKATSEVHKLSAEINRLKSARINITPSTGGIAQAHNRLNALRTAARQPFTMGQFVGAGLVSSGIRKAWSATKEGTREVDVGTTNLDMLQLGEKRRARAEAEIDRTMRHLESMPGAQQFHRGLVQQRFAEALLQVREGEAAKGLRIPLDKAKPWKGDRAATPAEMAKTSAERMEQARLRTQEELNIADIIAKRTGVAPEIAVQRTAGYFKAMDQAGWFTTAGGDFDPEGLAKGGNFVRRMIGMVGEEATGRFMHTLFKREKGAKFSLSERGQLTAAIIAEDMDPATAGTALSSWMRQTQGQGITKQAAAARVDAGLMTPIYGPQEYTKKGKPKKRKITGYDVKGAELAMTDPARYAKEVLIPGLMKMGLSMEQIQSNRPEDMAKVKNALDKLHSNVNAAQFAQILVSKADEINKQIIDAYTRDASQQGTREASKLSVTGSINAITGQFKGMMGQAVVALAPAISSVATGVSNFFKDNADDIQDAAKGDVGAITRLGINAAGVAVPAVAGLWAVRKAMEATGVAGAVGWTSGMMAMTSDNDAIRSLGGAGVSLIEAAGALKEAAATLSGDPSLGPGGPDKDGKKKPGGRPRGGPGGRGLPRGGPGGAGGPGFWTRMGTYAAQAGGAVLTVAKDAAVTVGRFMVNNPGKIMKGAGILTAAGLAYDFVQSQPDDAKTRRERLENKEKLAAAQKKLTQSERAASTIITKAGGKPLSKGAQRALDVELERIRNLRQEIEERGRIYEGSMFGAKATPVTTTKVAGKDVPMTPIPGSTPITPKDLSDAIHNKPVKTYPIAPDEVPAKPFGGTPILPSGLPAPAAAPVPAAPAPTATSDALALLVPQLTLVASSITLGATQLGATAMTFASVFGTGAAAIGASGSMAAGALTGAAPGIGAAIGDAAASAIRAAVSNLSIDVHANVTGGGKGADTGGQKTD